MIDEKTALYGVMGNPVHHSLSPVLHNAAFGARGINAVYLAFETADPGGCLRGMKALGIRGMSVTMPHKADVIPFLDRLDVTAARVEAVNTIVNRGGQLIGYNTDVTGAVGALREKVCPSGMKALIVGAGGAARAVGFGLKEYGIERMITNRSPRRGKAAARLLDCSFVALERIGDTRPDLIVQATPVGMQPDADENIVPTDLLGAGVVVMDILYGPGDTKLIREAKARRCLTINGLDMFLHQGAAQFKLWTGLEPPLEAMRASVHDALAHRS
jgi:shikimate dehydrogenase